ncbi:peptidoglycan recognition protein family protein [Candidatus Darwinibacter acetoxidans]
MAVQIIQDFIPKGRKNRPGYKMTPRYITIHDTANPGAGANAKAHAAYLRGAAAAAIPASWHFTVDDKVIYQHLPLTENGWHAGDGTNGTGNRQSIGIEICENRDGNRVKAEANAAWLVAKLLKDYGLKITAVKQHYDWSKKNCPNVLRGRKDGWKNFLAAVESHLKAGDMPAITRAIGLEVDGKAVKEVGYLIDNATYVRAAYVVGLAGGKVTGHGDHIKIVLPAKTDPAEIAKLKAEINGLKAANAALEARIENARIALS